MTYEQLTDAILKALRQNDVVDVSEDKIADAVHARPDAGLYASDVQSAVERLCNENQLTAHRRFDEGAYTFRRI